MTAIPADQGHVRIEIRGLRRQYVSDGQDVSALHLEDDDEVQFRSGEITVVSGRSGSGKSTLLNILGGLDSPCGGQLKMGGRDCRPLSPAGRAQLRRENIAFLFQDGGLIERMTVLDNVLLPLRYLRGVCTDSRRAATEALDSVGLGEKSHRMVSCLSGGERHRVGLARALARRADILICDEPTAALDAGTSELVRERLRDEASRGACVVIASHDPILLDHPEFAHRLLVFEMGRMTLIRKR